MRPATPHSGATAVSPPDGAPSRQRWCVSHAEWPGTADCCHETFPVGREGTQVAGRLKGGPQHWFPGETSHLLWYKKNFNSGMNSPGRCTLWPHSLSPAPCPGHPHTSEGFHRPQFDSLLNEKKKKQERKLYVHYMVTSKITATGGHMTLEWLHQQRGFQVNLTVLHFPFGHVALTVLL